MTRDERFSEEISRAVGNYVYRLIDPRNGETFYVGKGTGNRIFEHARAAQKISGLEENDDSISLKLDRIKAIHDAHLQVIHVIHRHEIPPSAIYEVEAALIDAFPGLTNIQGGHGSGSRGPMSATEIITKFGLPRIVDAPHERLVLLNINKLEDRSDRNAVLRQAQLAWRISKEKAEKADYVLAVVRGVVVGAFVAENWMDATHANFPDLIPIDQDMPERKGFRGHVACDKIWDRFVGKKGKRIDIEAMKHVQNPVRYWNVE